MKFLFAVAVLLCGLNVHAASMSPAGSVNSAASIQSEPLSASGVAKVAGRVLILFSHPEIPDKL